MTETEKVNAYLKQLSYSLLNEIIAILNILKRVSNK